MTSLARRVFLRALRAFAALSLATVAVQGQAADAPTDSECEDAWTSSSASGSCGEDNSTYYSAGSVNAVTASVDTTVYYVVASNNQCRVEVDCLKSDRTVPPVSNDFSGSTDEVKGLHNCEGTLKEPNC